MPLVRLAQGPARSIADFPEGCARSAEGALHLVPGVARELTEDEVAHLKVCHGHLPLVVLQDRARRRPPAVQTKTAKASTPIKPADKTPDKDKET